MSILVDKNTRLLVQGITGKEGSYHAQRSSEYGANLVAGVTPGKGGQTFLEDVPIYDTVEHAVRERKATASLIFVPPAFAADAIFEAFLSSPKFFNVSVNIFFSLLFRNSSAVNPDLLILISKGPSEEYEKPLCAASTW